VTQINQETNFYPGTILLFSY